MQKLTPKDLENVFLIIVRQDKGLRAHLPFIRRHYRSVVNLCGQFIERPIDIYYSGILLARKNKNQSKIIFDREYRQMYPEQTFEHGASV